MFANLSVGAIRIDGLAWTELTALAVRHGFAGVDPPLGEIGLMADPQDATRRLADQGLVWGVMGLPGNFCGTESDFEQAVTETDRMGQLAGMIGCRRCNTFILPFHDELSYAVNFDLHARRLGRMATTLERHGIRLGIEFIGPRTLRSDHRYEFVHGVGECLELCDAIGHNCGVLLDSFHWYTSSVTEEDIVTQLAGRVVSVHVNDGIRGRSRDEQLDRERALPGDTGVIDLGAFVRGLRRIEYDGPVTAEPMIQAFAEEPAEEVARRVSDAIRRTLDLA